METVYDMTVTELLLPQVMIAISKMLIFLLQKLHLLLRQANIGHYRCRMYSFITLLVVDSVEPSMTTSCSLLKYL